MCPYSFVGKAAFCVWLRDLGSGVHDLKTYLVHLYFLGLLNLVHSIRNKGSLVTWAVQEGLLRSLVILALSLGVEILKEMSYISEMIYCWLIGET